MVVAWVQGINCRFLKWRQVLTAKIATLCLRPLQWIACLAVSACVPADAFRHYTDAVGPDLYSNRTVNNTVLLRTYTESICAQAGFFSDGQGRCQIVNATDWKTFVDMGLYDIDQRCDTFLDNLYYKDKSQEPILAQISNTRTFTRAVLEATQTSITGLAIVAAAFDLTENTFRNTRQSLLEALDPTTVKSIVFRRQQEIKRQIYGTTISSKPQALHALRTYLRVCMPFTIEMEANAILTSVQRTDEVGESPITFNAEKFRAELRSTPETGASSGTGENKAQTKTANDHGRFEENIAPGLHRRFAGAICVRDVASTAQDFGATGSNIRKAILAWETGLAEFKPTAVTKNGIVDTVEENDALIAITRESNPYRCDATQARVKNTYEAAVLSDKAERTSWQKAVIEYLQGIEAEGTGLACHAKEAKDKLVAALPGGTPNDDFGPVSREALRTAKSCLRKSSSPPSITEDDQLEPGLETFLQS